MVVCTYKFLAYAAASKKVIILLSDKGAVSATFQVFLFFRNHASVKTGLLPHWSQSMVHRQTSQDGRRCVNYRTSSSCRERNESTDLNPMQLWKSEFNLSDSDNAKLPISSLALSGTLLKVLSRQQRLISVLDFRGLGLRGRGGGLVGKCFEYSSRSPWDKGRCKAVWNLEGE